MDWANKEQVNNDPFHDSAKIIEIIVPKSIFEAQDTTKHTT